MEKFNDLNDEYPMKDCINLKFSFINSHLE